MDDRSAIIVHRPSSIVYRPTSIVYRPSSIVYRPSSRRFDRRGSALYNSGDGSTPLLRTPRKDAPCDDPQILDPAGRAAERAGAAGGWADPAGRRAGADSRPWQ